MSKNMKVNSLILAQTPGLKSNLEVFQRNFWKYLSIHRQRLNSIRKEIIVIIAIIPICEMVKLETKFLKKQSSNQ